jgi:predicted translin family RNA/ssDNA-binding protein
VKENEAADEETIGVPLVESEAQMHEAESPADFALDTLMDNFAELKVEYADMLNSQTSDIERNCEETILAIERANLASFNLDKFNSYLIKNKEAMEQTLTESNRQRIEHIVKISNEIKALSHEAIKALRANLGSFYDQGKSKFSEAISEMEQISFVQENNAESK